MSILLRLGGGEYEPLLDRERESEQLPIAVILVLSPFFHVLSCAFSWLVLSAHYPDPVTVNLSKFDQEN